MQVHSVNTSSAVAPAAKGAHRADPVEQRVTPKKDTLVLSEKAKDLAALKAGKAAQEESTESLSAKAKEGDID